MTRIALYLPIEIKKRELDAQLLLGFAAASNDYTVFIGSHSAIYSLLEQKPSKSGIYLDKGIPPLSKLKILSEQVDAICIMDAEISPILSRELALQEIRSRVPEGTEEYLNCYFLPSDDACEAAMEVLNELHTRIKNTGWPRFDIWNSLGEEIYREEIIKIKRDFGNYLLFVSSFGDISDPVLHLKQIRKHNPTPSELWSIESRQLRFANYKHVIEILKNWDLDADVPPIIVRPHPSEKSRIWERDLGRLKKTFVKSEGDVSKWIAGSIGVIHQGSTVSLQARIMGKKLFFFSEVATLNFVEKAEKISNFVVGNSVPPRRDRDGNWTCEVNPNFSSTTDSNLNMIRSRSSIDSILCELNKLTSINGYTNYVYKPWKSEFILRKIRRGLGLIRDEIYWKIGKLLIAPQSQKIPGNIRSADIERVRKAIGNNSEIKTEKLGVNLWCIESAT